LRIFYPFYGDEVRLMIKTSSILALRAVLLRVPRFGSARGAYDGVLLPWSSGPARIIYRFALFTAELCCQNYRLPQSRFINKKLKKFTYSRYNINVK
jgi:hypothetical protein